MNVLRGLIWGIAAVGSFAVATADEPAERLLEAARAGNVAEVARLLDTGLDVNSANRYGATALTMAADQGRLEVVRLLIDRGAKIDVRDTFYQATPVSWAANNGHADVVRLLVEKGAARGEALGMALARDKGDVVAALVALGEPAESTLASASGAGKANVVERLLATATFTPKALDKALAEALGGQHQAIAKMLESAGATPPKALQLSRTALKALEGEYRAVDGGVLKIDVRFRELSARLGDAPAVSLQAASESEFASSDGALRIVFEKSADSVSAAVSASGEQRRYERVGDASAATAAPNVDDAAEARAPPANWPSFRGVDASGVADGQGPPIAWNVATKENLAWEAPIAGLGHSCPVVWGDRVYLTSAESGDPNSVFKPGAYGDVDSVDDPSVHRFWVYCLDRHTGKELWKRLAHEGVPKFKRHMKSSHANPTPATNGRYVVASFGAEGVFCYDARGKLVWKLALDALNSGWFFQPDYEWGFGSSPIIYGDWVILQCDSQEGSFLAAYELSSGQEVWKAARDEVPTWSTPTVVRRKGSGGETLDEIVTNGTRAIRGYDAQTGAELWKLVGNSEIVVPTPIVAEDRILVTSGYRPVQPIYAIRPGGRGDLTPPAGQSATDWVAWSTQKGGPYMPTPLAYRGRLYVLGDGGVLTCYELESGKRLYQKRVGGQFTASPVAADGRLYLTSEDGKIHIIRDGDEYQEIAVGDVAETCLSTPAICDGVLLVRTEHRLLALGKPRTPKPSPPRAAPKRHGDPALEAAPDCRTMRWQPHWLRRRCR